MTIESDMMGGATIEAAPAARQNQSTSAGNRAHAARAPIADSSALEKIADLVRDIRFAMLTTVCEDGALRSRPMATQDPAFDNGDVWFFTSDDSPKTDEVAREHEVNLAYAEPKDQRYVSLSGTATVVHDREKIRRLWKPILKTWFPKGLDDPHLALLRVRVHTAEYWDAPGGRMASLYAYAKSRLTGQAPEDSCEHEKVAVRS